MSYIKEPQYANFFKNFDKKLTKNIMKRCVVDVFAIVMARPSTRTFNSEDILALNLVLVCIHEVN